MSGASLCMPDRWLQAEPLCRFMTESKPTLSGAVPTVWNDVLGYLDEHPEKKPESLRLILCGGSAVPVAAAEGAPGPARPPHPPGLGDDRDLSGRVRRPAAGRRRG